MMEIIYKTFAIVIDPSVKNNVYVLFIIKFKKNYSKKKKKNIFCLQTQFCNDKKSYIWQQWTTVRKPNKLVFVCVCFDTLFLPLCVRCSVSLTVKTVWGVFFPLTLYFFFVFNHKFNSILKSQSSQGVRERGIER